jgi:hypothetical protein
MCGRDAGDSGTGRNATTYRPRLTNWAGSTYCLLGVVFGFVEDLFWRAFSGGVSIGLGASCWWGLATAGVELPWLTAGVGGCRASRYLRQRSFRALAILGVLNGLLPCIGLRGGRQRHRHRQPGGRRRFHGLFGGHIADDAGVTSPAG